MSLLATLPLVYKRSRYRERPFRLTTGRLRRGPRDQSPFGDGFLVYKDYTAVLDLDGALALELAHLLTSL